MCVYIYTHNTIVSYICTHTHTHKSSCLRTCSVIVFAHSRRHAIGMARLRHELQLRGEHMRVQAPKIPISILSSHVPFYSSNFFILSIMPSTHVMYTTPVLNICNFSFSQRTLTLRNLHFIYCIKLYYPGLKPFYSVQ